MRRSIACLLALLVAGSTAGCGGASGIETGIPKNAELPKDFDPGGTAKPNMTGKAEPAAKPATKP